MEPRNKLFDFASARMPADSPVAVAAAAREAMPAQPEFTDTVQFRSPVIQASRQHLDDQRVIHPGAPGPIGSPYKMLRTQVLRRLEQLGANTLAVMSPTEGAGRTLTAINLAIAIAAETGRTALLVDLDLRSPAIHRRFGFSPELGVEECLLSRHPVQDAMVKILGYERLTLLPGRSRVENSSELLSDQIAGQLVQELRTRYANRVVIFDLPPVLQADDALAFSRHVQAGLMVVGERQTQRDDVVRAIEMLRELPIVGTVLNGARATGPAYY